MGKENDVPVSFARRTVGCFINGELSVLMQAILLRLHESLLLILM